MRKKLEVAAKNTTWWYFGLRAIYCRGGITVENSLEATIFYESLMCAYYVRDALIRELCNGYGVYLLNRPPEYIISKYSTEYPELCLILCSLGPFGPLSPIGLASDLAMRSDVDRIFGTRFDSPLYDADFYSKKIPIIRITKGVFTLGTDQPRFESNDDVKDYYRNEARIEEISKMCMFWIRKFYEE